MILVVFDSCVPSELSKLSTRSSESDRRSDIDSASEGETARKEDNKTLRIKFKMITKGENPTYEIVKPSDERDELNEKTLPRKEAKKRKNEEAETEKAKRRKTKKASRKETEKAERSKTEEAKKKKSEEAETEDAKKRKGEEAQSERNESKLVPKEVFPDGNNSKDPKHESKSPPSKSSPSRE
ncbi:translation initiation factor IF-2-like [Harmonia axyridis]|uniref:translation initiation factor IF-2-like n=1 Tax=Harmonia axyridis TaxID=115357 RepID=UPI001E278553|nr:translation initiation factor IF-2-like [Harmonia axyridis]